MRRASDATLRRRPSARSRPLAARLGFRWAVIASRREAAGRGAGGLRFGGVHSAQASPATASPPQGGDVLLVEDDDELREVMAGALAADGHRVVEAAHGGAALDALAARPFDLLLLDLALGPGPDGIEVCRRLRRAGADLHVLVLTARDGEAHVVL